MTVSDSSSLLDNHLSKETTVFFKSTSMIDNNANTDKLTTLQNELSYETTNTDKIQTNNADTIPVITSKLETSLGDTTKTQNTQSTEILDHTTEHSVTDFSNSITDHTLEISDISSKVSKVSLEYSTRNVEYDSTKYKTDDYVETSTIGKFEPRSETIQTTNPASIEKTTSYEELKSDSAKFQSTDNIKETASTSTSDKEISTQIRSELKIF